MCGIAGWYRRNGRPVTDDAVTAQCNAILHRGPDDSGILIDDDFGFGMRRLSILDIARGHQPMTTPDGRYAIVFNGEIYNHRDIRARLGAEGHSFRGHSDTETILAAFGVWGDDTWPMLEGMFAIALWDRDRRRLTLARDPLGIKPLYVSQQNGGLSFASELKALRMLPDHAFDIDERAVHDFFSFGHVRKPRSIFRQVRMLDPGTSLTIGPQGAGQETTYWRPRFRLDGRHSAASWTSQMGIMLTETTARHMQADVPVAAFLSGGIDSSAVLAAMRRATDQPLKAFTIGYPGTNIDETAAAREIADHLGCEHTVLPLQMDDVAETLPTILQCFDEPFADLAAIPTWYASKLAAEHVKVVLCGEGGDELFAGYKRHRNARMIERFRPMIAALEPIAAMIDHAPVVSSPRINYLSQKARRAAEFMRLPDGYQQFFAATQISSRRVRRQLYAPGFWDRVEGDDGFAQLEAEYFPANGSMAGSALDQFLQADLTLNMPSAMLTRLDRTSMAHSLEARVPFLSHRMVDWALTVPGAMKLNGGTGKIILRKAIAPWLPESVMRRPKQGFQIPHTAWLKDQLGDLGRQTWRDSGAAAAGYLDNRIVERLFTEHRRGDADHARLLYAITVFALWWQSAHASPRVIVR